MDDAEYAATQLVYGTTLKLPGGFVGLSSFPLNMGINIHMIRLIGVMGLVKPTSTRPQSTDIFIRRDLLSQPLRTAHKEPYKPLDRKPKYYTVDENRTYEIGND